MIGFVKQDGNRSCVGEVDVCLRDPSLLESRPVCLDVQVSNCDSGAGAFSRVKFTSVGDRGRLVCNIIGSEDLIVTGHKRSKARREEEVKQP